MARGKHNRPARIPGRDAVELGAPNLSVGKGADINVIVRAFDAGYPAYSVSPYPHVYRVGLSPSDLAAVSASMNAHLEAAILDGSESDLGKLAHIGHELFQELIQPEELRSRIAAAPGSPDLDSRPGQAPLRIDVTTTDCQCPWGLLYIRDPDLGVDPELFLGGAHVLNRLPHAERFYAARPAKLVSGQPRLRFATNSDLGHAEKYEIPRLRQLTRDRFNLHRADVDALGAFGGERGDLAAADFRRRLTEAKAQIIHVACHGHSGDGKPDRVVIDNEFEIDAYMFRKRGFALSEAPVVFLNACEMGRVSAATFASFAMALLDAGVRAVLAPECAVRDDQATYFANAFYKYFVRQAHTIADATWLAKRERLRRGDISALAYSLFGQPETYIDTALAA